MTDNSPDSDLVPLPDIDSSDLLKSKVLRVGSMAEARELLELVDGLTIQQRTKVLHIIEWIQSEGWDTAKPLSYMAIKRLMHKEKIWSELH